MNQFFAELKRRHVWRVAIAYAVSAWLLLQLASIVLPTFAAPGWVLKVLIAVFVLFFPVALIIAWAFEATPEGVRRTLPAEANEARPAPERRRVGRRIDFVIIAVLAAAVGVLAWQLTARPAVKVAPSLATSAPAATTKITAKSIAVLPFENLSADKNNEYFVAGMQDLILTKLADIGDLKVISRTSTMQYGSHPGNLKTIGQQLGVANLLEGSVQKQGNQVLISVQLIDTQSDAHLWAESYTRTLDDIFGVEGEVAERIATALNAKLSPAQSARLVAAPTTNRTAYDLFLRAEFQLNSLFVNGSGSYKAAILLYRQAIAEDPNFALAYARLSFAESDYVWDGNAQDAKRLYAQARADAERALELAPDLAAAHVAIGYSDYYGRRDFSAALKAFDAALALRPNDTNALVARGFIERRQGRFDDAIASLTQAQALDPRNNALARYIGETDMMIGRYAEAEAWLQRALALEPEDRYARFLYTSAILFGRGDVARALAATKGAETEIGPLRAGLLMLQRKYREAIALLESVPDTPDNFRIPVASKALRLADLYQLAGDMAKARSLYAEALPKLRARLAGQQDLDSVEALQGIADAELGLGHTAEGLAAIAKSEVILAKAQDAVDVPGYMSYDADLYATAGRADRAVALLAKALGTPGIGQYYSPVMLWLDPFLDPIRPDPSFQALLKQYAKYKPAVTYTAVPSGGASTN